MSEEKKEASDSVGEKDFLLDLSFGPSWARRPAGQTEPRYRDRPEREESDNRRRHEGQGRFRDADRRDRPPPRRDRPPAFSRIEMPDRRREFIPRAPVRISFVPEPRQLSALVRQLRGSRKAYPLTNLAVLLSSKPDFCWVKIESLDGERRLPLHACRLCRGVSLDRATLVAHMVRAHLDDFFTREETETEPPSGQFVCVARCGLSGILLGPPNHHSYADKLQEVHLSRHADMPFEEYRKRVEMRREPELIEQWRSEACKQTLYRLKKDKGQETPSEPMSRAAAEAYLTGTVASANAGTTVRSVLPLATALDMEDRQIRQAVRDAWQRETRAPRSLLFAMRAAFRHKKLHLFRTGKEGGEYVTDIDPVSLDLAHAVAPVREILTHLRARPGCKREELLATLRPGAAPGSPEARELFFHVAWLVEKGHIMEFYDGSLADAQVGEKYADDRAVLPPPDAAAAEPTAKADTDPPPAPAPGPSSG